MEEKRYCVYLHTSPSGKHYVGITSQNPKDRWDYGYGYKQNKHFWFAIQKYGWNNIKHDVLLTELSKKEAKQNEILLIKKYKSDNGKYGYNNTKGGDIPFKNNCKQVYQFKANGDYIKSFKTTREAERITRVDHNSINKCCNGKMNIAGGYVWSYKYDNDFSNLLTDRRGKIIQISMTNLSIVHIFNNVEELGINMNFNRYQIYKVCEFKKDNYKKYYWCYEKDINRINEIFKPKGVMQIDIDTNKVIKMFPDIISASIESKVSLEAIRSAICGIQNTSAGYKWALI